MTIDTAVANPFKILSAYFITVATISPPIAYRCIIIMLPFPSGDLPVNLLLSTL